MRLDEITPSYYNIPDFNDEVFDVELKEIDELYLEIDDTQIIPIWMDIYNHTTFFTMLNVCFILVVYSTLIKQYTYETYIMLLFNIIAHQNTVILPINEYNSP
jgi:hypothetical protein|tara:strand:+ start:450 stop:758 length:309 start_codon:yes stop_codon:yes gene_type:complete